jgi:site-specific DNA-methyltransferase (adenine-specific)
MLELNKIYNENCSQTMERMPDNFIDLTVTSPPYDTLRKYHGYIFDFESIAKELYRVTKKGGVVVWVVGDATIKGSETGTSFRQALYFKEIGFNLHDTMIYQKKFYVPLTHRRYEQSFEYMFIFSKEKPKTFNPLMVETTRGGKVSKLTHRKTGDKIIHGTGYDKPRNYFRIKENIFSYCPDNSGGVHPAPFPEQLVTDHIFSWSNESDLIYDPFMGSGTTAKCCILLNRHFIGSEISEEYCTIANNRILCTSTKSLM